MGRYTQLRVLPVCTRVRDKQVFRGPSRHKTNKPVTPLVGYQSASLTAPHPRGRLLSVAYSVINDIQTSHKCISENVNKNCEQQIKGNILFG